MEDVDIYLKSFIIKVSSIHTLNSVVFSGEWKLHDKCLGVSLVNRFDVKEVYKCMIHWGTGTVNLELWSEQRPVSKQSPLSICHEYEVIKS